MSIELVMLSNHLILCCPLLLVSSICNAGDVDSIRDLEAKILHVAESLHHTY